MLFWQEKKAGFESGWLTINAELAAVRARQGLAGAFRALSFQQRESGFIADDLSAVVRYHLVASGDPDHFFSVQYNPRRALRFKGAGNGAPPVAGAMVNQGCFLCRDNIFWQQDGQQLGMDLTVCGESFTALANPFPLMPDHLVVATRGHVPQDCHLSGGAADWERFRVRLDQLLTMAAELPGWVVFYNGVDAGASIPHHMHFQVIRRPEGLDLFPLERAARRAGNGTRAVDGYPLPVSRWSGDRETVLNDAFDGISAWVARNRAQSAHLSANLVATLESGGSGAVALYFVPRLRRTLVRDPVAASRVGGLEVLGEYVTSTADEKHLLDEGLFDYSAVHRILGTLGDEIRTAFPQP